jgi:hypothetical protein
MTTNNAINLTAAGVVSYNGAGTFTGSVITQYDVLVAAAGTSNAISSVGPGIAGQVFQSGGNAALPAYSTATYPSTAGTSGNVLTSDGTNFNSTAPSGTNVVTWTDKAASFAAAAGNGYFVTATATATLPATPTEGQTISFIADSATPSVITILANASQFIRLAGSVSVVGGTAVNVARGDAITLVYRTADLTWIALNSVGNWTIT